ncbi:MAG: matrixin family metalloprotease [Opitutus sp.]|nr:matrixin family metalloprotease [Opitutus sp.]
MSSGNAYFCGGRLALSLVGALFTAGPAHAFNLFGTSLPNGNTVMNLQLGPTTTPLADGAADWAAVAESALNEWNGQMGRSKFTVVRDSTEAVGANNRVNNVIFRPDVFGTQWSARELAVTLVRNTDRDVVINSNLAWDSYRGPQRTGTFDFRRVALHEFGHVLSLGHPDEAVPFQSVSAIMTSTAGNVESLRTDDINGVKFLYDVTPARTVPVTGSFTLAAPVSGPGPFTYTWYFRSAGGTRAEFFRLATGPSYTIGSTQTADAGTYAVMARNSVGAIFSDVATLSLTAVATAPDTTLANISTRGVVGTGSGVLIAGLVIGGTSPKNVLIRAAGPALADFGVAGALADPTLTLFNAQNQTVAQNDNWETGGNAAPIAAAATRLGAFQFKVGSRDSAVLAILPPGNYTAIVSGVGDTTGIALVEAYDADPDPATARTRRLVNIATRGQVNTGENVLIAGLVVTGPGPRTFLIRAIGLTLARAPFNLSGVLLDPFLQIYRGETLLRENDDWDSSISEMSTLRTTSAQVGAFAMVETRTNNPPSGLDAAIIVTLQPGSYTAKVSGFEGATGLALVEIYELP